MPDTNLYNFWFADAGTETMKYPEKDRERWEALEIQITELYSMFLNGVNEDDGEGWRFYDTVADGPIVYITPGHGHVEFKYAETTENYALNLIVPNGVDLDADGITYYVYGYANETTHYDKSITFEAFTVEQDDDSYIYLGSFVLKTSDGSYVLASKNYDDRDSISIFSAVSQLINSHVHTGNPPKINLQKHVSGKLPGAFIDSSLDASQITSGRLDLDRLPEISHDSLTENGVLTHAQIDTFYTNQQISVDDHLAEVAFANWLQEIIAQKALYINFDEYFINAFFYIPGVTSSNYVDSTGTTALIDSTYHQIVGIEAAPTTSDLVTWSGYTEFTNIYTLDSAGKNENLYVHTDGTLTLDIPLNFMELYNTTVDTSNPKHWNTYTEVTTTESSSSNTVLVNAKLDYYRFYRFWSGSGPITKDLSYVNKIQFGIKLTDPTILEHGKIYFYLVGAQHQTLDSKTISYTDAINSNTYSVSISGAVQILAGTEQTSDDDDDIKLVNIDLLQFIDRDTVQGFGFFITTDDDWNIADSYQFTLHQPPYADMDEKVAADLQVRDSYSVPDEGTIVVYAYNNLYYEPTGKVYFRFSQPLQTEWDYVYWDVDIPTIPVGVVDPYILVKTLSASSSSLLAEANPYLVSESTHLVGSENNKYLDILVEFKASSDRRYSPSLNYVTLYYTIASSANSKSFSTASQFADALKLVNILISSNPDSISMDNTALVNALFFLEGDAMKVIDEDQNLVSSFSFDGSTIYESPRQIFAKAGKGFRKPRYLGVLEEGFLIVDTYNDRIVEIDYDGDLVYGIQGNVYLPRIARDFVALTANYNTRLGKLYVAFSQNFSSSFDRTKFTLSTSDRSNSFSFLTDDDGVFTTVPDINGESAVLVITLGTARKQQVDNWSANKVLLIAQDAITGSAGTTQSTSSTTTTTTTTEETPSQVIIQSVDGTITIENPTNNTVVDEAVTDETNTYDFDGDDDIDSATLMDVNGETSIVTVLVEDADIIYANIQYPLSAEKSGDENYIIAQDNEVSALNIGIDESTVWDLTADVVSFDWTKGGNIEYQSDGSILCASPDMQKVLQIIPSTEAIIFSYTPKFTPVFATRNSDGNTVIVENDELYNSLNSRITEIDTNKDVVREWGLGRLTSPTGIYVLSNDNWLISC